MCSLCYSSSRHALFHPVVKTKKNKKTSSRRGRKSDESGGGMNDGDDEGVEEVTVNVKDLESTNGTKINGVLLKPNR
jgi:hypothetical protein